MFRVVVIGEGERVSVNGIEYDIGERGEILVQESQVPHFEKHPHLFRVVGEQNVKIAGFKTKEKA